MEKAHRDVFNVLLQVLDDGRLTDGQGRTVDFKNSVIIMTSNIGSQMISEMAEQGDDVAMQKAMEEILRKNFLPEFLNRIDEKIIFHPLGYYELRKIVDIQLKRMVAQMTEAGLVLEMTDKAKEQLAEEGYDPAYGARPLKRVLQQRVANPMASSILAGKFPQGATILIDWNLETSQFTFTPKA